MTMPLGAVFPRRLFVIPKRRFIARGICCVHENRLAPIGGQIIPQWVIRLDQRHFFLPAPAFDFGLASNGIVYVSEHFVIDQTVNVISASKAVSFSSFVL